MKEILFGLLFLLPLQAHCANQEPEKRKSHHISITIDIDCPMSEELDAFVKSIPPEGSTSKDFEEWKTSFVHNMTQLIRLVQSEKVLNSSWSVKTDDALPKAEKK